MLKRRFHLFLLSLVFILICSISRGSAIPGDSLKTDLMRYKPTLQAPFIKSGKFSKPKDKGFYFGLNLGGFWGHRYHANFYNGSAGNVDSIGLIFSNYYYREDIRRELNDTFRLQEMPTQMHYKTSIQIGFYIKYNFTPTTGAFIQFNYAKLKAQDYFTMAIGGEPQYLTFDDIRLYPIWGTEERIFIDIGFSQTFPIDKTIQPFLEAGININNTRVIENKIAIGSLEYSLINIYGNSPYVPNTQMQTYESRLGGIGIGGFATAGIKLVFNKNVSMDPGFTFLWNNVNLEGYQAYRPQYSVFVRFCFRNLFNSDQTDSE